MTRSLCACAAFLLALCAEAPIASSAAYNLGVLSPGDVREGDIFDAQPGLIDEHYSFSVSERSSVAYVFITFGDADMLAEELDLTHAITLDSKADWGHRLFGEFTDAKPNTLYALDFSATPHFLALASLTPGAVGHYMLVVSAVPLPAAGPMFAAAISALCVVRLRRRSSRSA